MVAEPACTPNSAPAKACTCEALVGNTKDILLSFQKISRGGEKVFSKETEYKKARTRLKALCEDSQANAGCVSVEMQRLKALARPVVSGLVPFILTYCFI
jgi:hypothetical protein